MTMTSGLEELIRLAGLEAKTEGWNDNDEVGLAGVEPKTKDWNDEVGLAGVSGLGIRPGR